MKNSEDVEKNIISSIGRKSPRLAGLFIFCLGLALAGGNVLLIGYKGYFYPGLFFLGFVCSAIGFWILVTGRISEKVSGKPVPLWWKAGSVVCTIIGAAAGLSLEILFY